MGLGKPGGGVGFAGLEIAAHAMGEGGDHSRRGLGGIALKQFPADGYGVVLPAGQGVGESQFQLQLLRRRVPLERPLKDLDGGHIVRRSNIEEREIEGVVLFLGIRPIGGFQVLASLPRAAAGGIDLSTQILDGGGFAGRCGSHRIQRVPRLGVVVETDPGERQIVFRFEGGGEALGAFLKHSGGIGKQVVTGE